MNLESENLKNIGNFLQSTVIHLKNSPKRPATQVKYRFQILSDLRDILTKRDKHPDIFTKGTQIRTLDRNPDMGHKSGHLLIKEKFFIMKFIHFWVILYETFLKTYYQ